MQSIEEELTRVLHDQAESVPANPRLLTAVQARSRRRTLGHRVALAGAVAAAVAAVVVLPSVAGDLGIGGTRQGQQVATQDGFLVDGPFLPAAFPLTPTYLPQGVGVEPVSISGDIYGSHTGTWSRPGSKTDDTGIHVEISPSPSIWDPPAGYKFSQRSVNVNGRPGQLVVAGPDKAGSGFAFLQWQRQPGQYASVGLSTPHGDPAELLRIAEGLVDKPITPKWTFAVNRAPAGQSLQRWSPFMFLVGPPLPNVAVESDTFKAAGAAGIMVQANRIEANTRRYGTPVTVGDRSGWLKTVAGSAPATSTDGIPDGPDMTGTTFFTLTLQVSATTVLEFKAQTPVWSAERLKAFAAEVTYSGSTPPVGVNR